MKSFLVLFAAAATVVSSASCSSPASAPQSSATSSAAGQLAPAAFNDADVDFVTGMIPHHQQAVDMSALVPSRSTNEAVIKLAADISAAQEPEIQVMKVFLVQWTADDTGHQGRGDMAMDGMVDEATMAKLTSLQGAEFDTQWLQSMIGHHEGAVTMAQTEISSGANDDAKSLAQKIVAAQEAEVTQMKQMLGG